MLAWLSDFTWLTLFAWYFFDGFDVCIFFFFIMGICVLGDWVVLDLFFSSSLSDVVIIKSDFITEKCYDLLLKL